jgi:hypothetical protein
MADNTTLNTGTGGDVIATDDIAGVKYQRVKITLGADGVNGGDISSSNAMPVSDNGSSLTVDGSVSVSNFPATQAVSATNLDIRDLTATDVVTVTGGAGQTADVKVTLDGEQVAISNFPATQPISGTVTANAGTGSFTVSQATAANLNATVTGTVTVQDGGGSITIDGTVAATQSGTWSSRTQDGSGNNVTSRTTGSARPFDVAILDGSGNQVTSFGGGTQYTDGAVQATPTGTVAMGTDGTNVYAIATDNSGNIGVNIQNTVNVSDAGGSITIDGSVTANQPSATAYRVIVSDGTSDVPIDAAHSDAETNTENHIDVGAKGLYFNGSTWDRMRGSVADGLLVNLGTNNDITGTVTANAGTGTFVVGDGGSSLTVDGTVTVTDGLNIEGDVAHDTVDSGNPVKIGFQAETSFPTAVATGDRSNGISDVFGRQLVAHVDAGMQVWKGANYTTQQTGADIWTPSAGKKICITYLAVSSYATTTGRVILWMGASGDTTYTAGTDQLIWAGSFAPSANAKPGAIVSLPYGITAVTADHRLKITTDAAISLDITVYGYEC